MRFLENVSSPIHLVSWTDEAFERIDRIVDLYESIFALAKRKLIPLVRCPMTKVREFFAYRNACAKYDIALHIANIIPALSHQVPPKRKVWMSEDPRQGLYDAAAIGLAYFSIDATTP